MPAAGVVLIVAVVLIVLALVYFLVSTIVALRQITSNLDEAIAGVGEIIEKSAPVAEVVKDINANLDAGVDLLEGLLVKKAGLVDSMGLVEGLYPGAAAEGLRNFPDSRTIKAPRISEVYTKGTLTLARLGREAPIAVASPSGPVLRNVEGGSLDARSLYPEERQSRPKRFRLGETRRSEKFRSLQVQGQGLRPGEPDGPGEVVGHPDPNTPLLDEHVDEVAGPVRRETGDEKQVQIGGEIRLRHVEELGELIDFCPRMANHVRNDCKQTSQPLGGPRERHGRP